MDCRECLDELHPFLDGESQPARAALVQGHLGSCAECLRRSQVEGALRRTLRSQARPVELPDGLGARLSLALDREDDAPAPSRRPVQRGGRGVAPLVRHPAFAFAAAAGAVLVTAFVAPHLGRDEMAPRAALSNPLQLSGRLVCVGCELASTPSNRASSALVPRREPPTHDPVLHLLDDAGSFWELAADPGDAADVVTRHDNAGRRVTVFGTAHAALHVLRVARAKLD